MRDFQRSLQDLDTALRLKPDDLRAWRVRGAVRERLGQDAGALADYSEALRRDPQDARLYLARSAVFVRLKKYSEALQDREQAVLLDPKNPGSLRGARRLLSSARTARERYPGPHHGDRARSQFRLPLGGPRRLLFPVGAFRRSPCGPEARP